MKKLISCLMLVAMLASLLTVGASAAEEVKLHDDKGKTQNIAYGTPVIDGKLDDAYLKSDKVNSYVYKGYNDYAGLMSKVPSSFYAYLLYDENRIYIFAEATDPNMAAPGTTLTKATTNNDCVEFFFYLDDFTTASKDAKLYADLVHPGSGQLRVHTSTVCPDDAVCLSHLEANNGLSLMIAGGDVKYELKRELTSTGYIVEFAMDIPADCKAAVAADKTIGFAIQMNDEIDGNESRDALLWSTTITGDPQKTGPFKLLAKDAAPATTAAPETTAAPTTTAAPVTTAAPAVTPSTADITPVFGLALLAAAAAIVAVRRRARD